jgi:dihydroorotate dehydrogenase electron transfer subunit
MTIAENICPVVSNDAVNSDYRLLVVDAPPVALAAEAGQFFHLVCPVHAADQPLLRRPMSVYHVDRARARMSFLYKVTGPGTRGLARLAPGDELDALGPLGRGFHVPSGTRHVLMLGRGVGLATLAPLAGLAISQGAKVTAVLSARAPEFLMSEDHFRAVGAAVETVTDSAGDSAVAVLKERLRGIHARDPIDFAATCGSNRLLLLLQDLAREWNIRGEVALEQHMGCGLGMCYACVRPFRRADGGQDYRRVCWDGPVFDLQEAMEWLNG